MTLVNLGGNTWVAQAMVATSNTDQFGLMSGSVTLAAPLTALRVTSVGAATFDGGSVNILYE
jgi:hypothetical protein